MKCDFDYCIYNRGFVCILDEVRIDTLGMCGSCEAVAVPEEVLGRYKSRRLEEIESTWKNYDK